MSIETKTVTVEFTTDEGIFHPKNFNELVYDDEAFDTLYLELKQLGLDEWEINPNTVQILPIKQYLHDITPCYDIEHWKVYAKVTLYRKCDEQAVFECDEYKKFAEKYCGPTGVFEAMKSVVNEDGSKPRHSCPEVKYYSDYNTRAIEIIGKAKNKKQLKSLINKPGLKFSRYAIYRVKQKNVWTLHSNIWCEN